MQAFDECNDVVIVLNTPYSHSRGWQQDNALAAAKLWLPKTVALDPDLDVFRLKFKRGGGGVLRSVHWSSSVLEGAHLGRNGRRIA
mgnify:CR=1 FL=1